MGCQVVFRIIKWIPPLFIFSIMIWSYYAYIFEFVLSVVEDTIVKILFILLFHVLFFLMAWSYCRTIYTDIAKVPQQFRVSNDELIRIMGAKNDEEQIKILKEIAKDLPITNCTFNGCVRFCDACRLIKPDRAHHCSVCNACLLKMDHHCPWVNNCVNYSNYKFFLLFLFWSLTYCLYVSFTILKYFIEFWRGNLSTAGRFHLLFLFIVAIMFGFSLISLFGYHVYLVLKNRTTLEAFRAPIFMEGGSDKNGYNLGYYRNFQEVFGMDKKLWLLPVRTELGDGIQYPRRNLLIQQC